MVSEVYYVSLVKDKYGRSQHGTTGGPFARAQPEAQAKVETNGLPLVSPGLDTC